MFNFFNFVHDDNNEKTHSSKRSYSTRRCTTSSRLHQNENMLKTDVSDDDDKITRSTQTDIGNPQECHSFQSVCMKTNKKTKYQIDVVDGLPKCEITAPAQRFFVNGLPPHPLLIPDVVSQIISYLPLPDLKMCRQVCALWDEEVIKHLPHMVRVSINSFDDLHDFLMQYGDRRGSFNTFKLGPHLNLQGGIVQKFFLKLGHAMKSLHLDRTHWIPASLRKILFERLPILEELILCSPRSFEDMHLNNINENASMVLNNIKILKMDGPFLGTNGRFIQDLLSVMPNLEILCRYKQENPKDAPSFSKMGLLRYEEFDNYVDLTTSATEPDLDVTFGRILLQNISDIPAPNLTNLKFIFDNDGLSAMRQRNFPLKYFHLIVPGSSFLTWHPRPSAIQNFLPSLSRTLTALKIEYCSGRPKLISSFDSIDRLKNLQHLHLHRVSGSLDFLNFLPNLKSLVMTQEDFIEHYDEFNIEEGRAHKLQCLKLYYTNWSASSVYSELPRPPKILNVVQNIVTRFPYLKSFRMETLTDKCLAAIYRNLTCLEEFEATNGVFTSLGISGISVIHQGAISGQRKLPHLGQLEKLTKLRLESNKMTDFAILSTVLPMEHLRELTLLCYKISDESLLMLVNRMKLDYLKTEFCYDFTPTAINYAKEVMFRRGRTAHINEFCSTLGIEQMHEFLNENGPVHVSIPDFSQYMN